MIRFDSANSMPYVLASMLAKCAFVFFFEDSERIPILVLAITADLKSQCCSFRGTPATGDSNDFITLHIETET